MSQNNSTTLYAGLDVAKATLQLSLHGAGHALDNDAKGHRRLIALLRAAQRDDIERVHVVLEATGGYERAAVRALHAAGFACSVMMPSRVRAFAQARGQLAKNDPIDADVLAAFGAAIRPAPTVALTDAQQQLDELVVRRQQLLETRVAELNRAAHYTHRCLLQQSRRLLATLDRQIAQCDQLIAEQLAADAQLSARAARLQQVPGVGAVTAAVLLAHLPELGSLADGQAAALAGLAPYDRDSGPRSGQRRICGGRATVRCALYMATLSAVRHDRILREFYQQLRRRGKLAKVALTAAMRKLLLLLNRLLRNTHFQLAS